jgi:two-component system sensor histidine kinase KdpD
MRESHPARAILAAVVGPVLATLLALPFTGAGGDVSAASLYMLSVVLAAAVGGVWSGLASSLLAFLGLNFFFTVPKHTFRVSKTEDLVALLVFLIVAAVVGTLLARALDERARAERRERETRLLNYFATKLLAAEPLDGRLQDLAGALVESFDLVRCEIHATEGDRPIDIASSRPGADGPQMVVPVLIGEVPVGTVTAVRRDGAGPLGAPDERLLQGCAKQLAVALEGVRLDAEIEVARLSSETSQIRAALFSSVTHDLRTPLASIKAGVTSLMDEDVAHDLAQRRELLQTVVEETDRLNRLVGNILDLAKVRAGALVPAKEPTAMQDVLESVLHRMQATLSRVVLRTVIRPNLPDVMADPVQLDQVLTNLLENAARFSPPGGEVQVTLAPWQESLQVRVTDQGPGIPADERERAFEPFYRKDAGGGRGGSGLGLAIARAVVLAHGGRIWIEGAPSGGTAVVFELPMYDAAAIPQEPVL